MSIYARAAAAALAVRQTVDNPSDLTKWATGDLLECKLHSTKMLTRSSIDSG